MGTLIVLGILTGIVFLAIKSIIKDKKDGKGCGSCSGGCKCCAGQKACSINSK